MGGKSYFCDYCCCYMKNDIKVRKKHNEGLAHTVARTTYLRSFEDPSKLLDEESDKVPCTRYLKGYCKFQLLCQYGHYSSKELEQLERLVKRLRRKQSKRRTANLHVWPVPQHNRKLPPSLQPIDFGRLARQCVSTQWG